MSDHDRIKSRHRERLALVYVRQSTTQQVRAHRESAARQYALAEQAHELGWRADLIRTIDADQGQSGSRAGERDGFARLRDEVAHGRVGAVFGLEVSRLARNSVEWFQLLDWCRTTDTLLVEGPQVYSPARHDDGLILGIKGTMSEAELFLIRERMQGGLRNKAARGELYHSVPVGYVREGTGLRKDPDQQVRHAIETVFARFREHGSARQATQALREEGLQLPAHRPGAADGLNWSAASYDRVISILKNPAMGGAYAYGRQRTERVLDEDDRVRRRIRRVPREDWQVLIEEHHAGYVEWEDWLAIQERLEQNSSSREGRPVREGRALLQGSAVCGHCGRSLRVHCGKAWSYYCPSRSEGSGRGGCLTVGGKRVDAWVAGRLLEAAQAAGVEAATQAWQQQQSREEAALRSRRLEAERCAYEASLAARRYRQADPDNRLVAGTLEREWELALRASEKARAELEQARQQRPPQVSLERLQALGERLGWVWESGGVTARDRKRLLACLVEEVMLHVDRAAGVIRILVRWSGGAIDEHELALRAAARQPARDEADTVTLVRRLAEHYPDSRTAQILNRQKRRTARGLPFTRGRVERLRARHDIPAHVPRPPDPEAPVLGIAGAAKELQVSESTLYRWVREGLLPAEQVTPGAPFRIRMSDDLRRRFCDAPPPGYVSLHAAMRCLGVSRQRIWQRIRDGELQARHIRRGSVQGLYVHLEEVGMPLLERLEAGHA